MGEKRLYHTVAEQIKGLILQGAYPPGSRLPGERDLADKFNVSRVTVREAEIALEALGLLDIRIGSGVYVLRSTSDSDIAHAMPEVSAFELTEARSAIESEAAALAAVVISDEELHDLDQLVIQMSTEWDPKAPLAEDPDKLFHLSIAKATKNNAIVEAVERLWSIRSAKTEIRQAYDLICGINPEMRLKEHQNIVIALRKHDAAAARKAMRVHFQYIIEAMLHTTEAMAIDKARKRTLESRERFLNNAASLSSE